MSPLSIAGGRGCKSSFGEGILVKSLSVWDAYLSAKKQVTWILGFSVHIKAKFVLQCMMLRKSLKYCKNDQHVTQRHEVSKRCWKNSADRLAWHRVATDLQLVIHVVSAYYRYCMYWGLPYVLVSGLPLEEPRLGSALTQHFHFQNSVLEESWVWKFMVAIIGKIRHTQNAYK